MSGTLHKAPAVHAPHYTERQCAILLTVARETLAAHLVLHVPPPAAVIETAQAVLAAHAATAGERAALHAPGACFVTLWRRSNSELRGCRGECRAYQPLVLAAGHMALAAAVDDPRFATVTAAELSDLRIEISVLTPLFLIAPEAVEVGRHGLMIVAGSRRGLLLPQVAVEHNLARAQFLEAVCVKAGLGAAAWRNANAELWAFETATWEEV